MDDFDANTDCIVDDVYANTKFTMVTGAGTEEWNRRYLQRTNSADVGCSRHTWSVICTSWRNAVFCDATDRRGSQTPNRTRLSERTDDTHTFRHHFQYSDNSESFALCRHQDLVDGEGVVKRQG